MFKYLFYLYRIKVNKSRPIKLELDTAISVGALDVESLLVSKLLTAARTFSSLISLY